MRVIVIIGSLYMLSMHGMQSFSQRLRDRLQGRTLDRQELRTSGIDVPLPRGIMGMTSVARKLFASLLAATAVSYKHEGLGPCDPYWDQQARRFLETWYGVMRVVCEHEESARSVRYLKEGVIASACSNREGNIWITHDSDGALLIAHRTESGEYEHLYHDKGPVIAYCLAPNQAHVAFARLTGEVQIITLEHAHDKKNTFQTCGFPIRSLAYTPNSRFIITCADDGLVAVWNAHTYAFVGTLPHTPFSITIRPGSTGARVVTTACDYKARVWNAATQEKVQSIFHPKLREAHLCHEDRLLATIGADRKARLWDVASGDEICALDHIEEIERGMMLRDDSLVTCAHGVRNIFIPRKLVFRICYTTSRRFHVGPLADLIDGVSLDEYELLEAIDQAMKDTQALRKRGVRNQRARIHATPAQWDTWLGINAMYAIPSTLGRILERYMAPLNA